MRVQSPKSKVQREEPKIQRRENEPRIDRTGEALS